ncbi:MAG: 6-bladed beta-propeller [Tannerella sp.]|jgi:hypothetical protein|nr:6-bladed beta-propeller [Tannerella sp.]
MVLIFSGCKKKDQFPLNVISVVTEVGNYKILNLSDYATEIRYVPLETSDLSLITYIEDICCENEKIFIYSSFFGKSDCLLFDNNGKFCSKIGQRGQGPDDYLNLTNRLIFKNFIYLIDSHKILVYDLNCNLIENRNLQSDSSIPLEYRGENTTGKSVPLTKDKYVIMKNTLYGYYPNAMLIEFDQSNAKLIKEYPNYVKVDKKPPGIYGEEQGIMYHFQDEVRFYRAINDTIFSISQNTEIKDAFIFDLGKYKTPLALTREDNLVRLTESKFIQPLKIIESNTYLFVNINFGIHTPEPYVSINRLGNPMQNANVYGIFDKLTGKLTLMRQPIKGKLGFKNDIDNGPVIWPHYISTNNELVTYISVTEFMEYYKKIDNPSPQLTAVANQIDMDDNQIVIIAKLKE